MIKYLRISFGHLLKMIFGLNFYKLLLNNFSIKLRLTTLSKIIYKYDLLKYTYFQIILLYIVIQKVCNDDTIRCYLSSLPLDNVQ